MSASKVLAVLITWFLLFLTMFVQSCQASELWVNTGGVSYHFDRSKNFNEVHPGVGLELGVSEDFTLAAGFHKNSLGRRSQYASVMYQPLHLGLSQYGSIKFGVSAGALDGYPLKANGGAFFAAIPMATWEGETFGINVGVIPNIPKQNIDGAFVIQFKFKVW